MVFDESMIWFVLLIVSLAVFVMGLIWQYEDMDHYNDSTLTRYLNATCKISTILAITFGILYLLNLGYGVNLILGELFIKIHMINLYVVLLLCPFTKFIKYVNLPFRYIKSFVMNFL
ncbi:hypothetical protein GMD78_06860 [Ornithinibacillus sp. L9]|uniref:Uncharacterized protein n=1 Tax=Ornithinibacillus caprae TaxID=2678566 RepID=A0A6N8FF11_9BACI|nr:hypothetical protein [Ornithinibacillus caprae]MUK88113.1 hypothetical protein [Ornithinibacillus caprae]